MARARSKVTKNTETTAAELDAIEAALNGEGDMDLELEINDASDIDEAELAAAVEADEAKEAAREAEPAKKTTGKKTSTKKASKPEEAPAEEGGEEKVVKKGRARGQFPSETPEQFADTLVNIFASEPAVFDTEEGALDEEGLRNVAAGVTQKKVREKVVNLLKAVMHGGNPTKYTEIANKILVDAYLNDCRPVTLGEIKDAYVAAGYKPGTVNAQAGQMMALYPALAIAKRGEVRGQIIPNANSVILDILASS